MTSASEIRNTAVVLAAGRGSRMKTGTPKQYLEIAGKPLYKYCLETFEKSALITDIVFVVPEEDVVRFREELRIEFDESIEDMPDASNSATEIEEGLCAAGIGAGLTSKIRAVVPGGRERYNSVNNALQAIEWPCDYVFIHDGARPFIDEDSIRRLYEAVKECGACVAGMPSKDTVKITDENGIVEQTPDRSHVWIIQTPQVFERKLITDAYAAVTEHAEEYAARGIPITDDAMIVELSTDHPVKLIEASYSNIKVTTPEDLAIAEALASTQ